MAGYLEFHADQGSQLKSAASATLGVQVTSIAAGGELLYAGSAEVGFFVSRDSGNNLRRFRREAEPEASTGSLRIRKMRCPLLRPLSQDRELEF